MAREREGGGGVEVRRRDGDVDVRVVPVLEAVERCRGPSGRADGEGRGGGRVQSMRSVCVCLCKAARTCEGRQARGRRHRTSASRAVRAGASTSSAVTPFAVVADALYREGKGRGEWARVGTRNDVRRLHSPPRCCALSPLPRSPPRTHLTKRGRVTFVFPSPWACGCCMRQSCECC